MAKRERSEANDAEERATQKVERSAESGRRFEAYIRQWSAEVAGELVHRPSQMPPLADVTTIASLATALGTAAVSPATAQWCRSVAAASTPGERTAEEALLCSRPAPAKASSRAGTGVVYDDAMLKHASDDPKDYERPARLRKTVEHLQAVGLLERCVRLKARVARTKELRRVHTRAHIDFVDQLDFFMSLKKDDSQPVGQDLYACKHTSEAARYAAGSVVEAARAVVRGEVTNAFAVVRPPGHHAGPETPSGFCFYNNVAVAARAAQAELVAMMENGSFSGAHIPCSPAASSAAVAHSIDISGDTAAEVSPCEKPRIVILDWDVHHCDGTEQVFYEDESVLVVSIHQYGNRRGHVLRKLPSVAKASEAVGTPSAKEASPPAGKGEMSVEALAALMMMDAPPSPPPEAAVSASPEEALPSGRRRRTVVDYNKLAEELDLHDDRAAAAALGVNLSSASSASSSSNSSSGSDDRDGDSIGGGGAPRYAGDTEGLSFDDMESEKQRTGEEEEEEELFYPGTGHIGRIGGEMREAAQGRNINVPWPAHGFGDLEYLRILLEIVIPAVSEFAPALVLVSCGFDSARGDLLGSMNLSASGYYAMTKLLSAHFPRLVVALEGGYNVSNVARCSEAVMRALLEGSCGGTGGAADSPLPPSRMLWCQTDTLVRNLHSELGPYWKCFSQDAV